MNKNIIILSYEYPMPWNGLASGVYELTINIAKILKENTFRVLSGTPGNPIETPSLNIKVRKGPKARRYISLYLTTSLYSLFYYLAKKAKRQADLVHGHNHITFWFNIYKLIFGSIDKTPYILTLHSTAKGRKIQIDEKLPLFTQYFEWPLHEISDKIGCKVADKVICTTQNVLDEATKHYNLDPLKAMVITDGVNPQTFNENVTNNKKARQLENKKILMFFGTISKRNQTEKLIHSFIKANIQNKFLYLIGDGEPQYIEEIRNILEQNNATQDVIVITDFDYNKLPPFYASCNLFIHNSVYEGSIQPTLQALSTGKTTLVSGFKINDQELEQNLIQIDKNLSVEELATLLEQNILTQKIIDTKYIQTEYSWDNIAFKYSSLYKTLLNSN